MDERRIVVIDWMPIRRALEKAYEVLGRARGPGGSLPIGDWNLASCVIQAYKEQERRSCSECREMIEYRQEIVCLDCKSALHAEGCAARHFWPPNGDRGGTARNHSCR